jgi:hypothetical protein
MTDIGFDFNANDVEPNTGPPPPLPTDWYNAMITNSEMRETKDKTGGFLELTFKVMDGPYSGRQFWDRLNLYNQSPVAVEIAQKTLSAICHAVEVFQVRNAQVLHGRPLMARVVETPPSGQYDAGNDVKGYAKPGAKESKNAAGVKLEPQHGAAPQSAPTPTNGPTPSWAQTPTPPTPTPTPPPPTPPSPPAPTPPPAPPSGAPVTPPWARQG